MPSILHISRQKSKALLKKFFLDFSNGKGSAVIVWCIYVKEEVLRVRKMCKFGKVNYPAVEPFGKLPQPPISIGKHLSYGLSRLVHSIEGA